MAASDPFAFSKQRTAGRGHQASAAPAPEWVFPAQQNTGLPNVGSMGTIGQAAPFLPPLTVAASAPVPTYPAMQQPESQPAFFQLPTHQRGGVPAGAFDPSVIAQVASNPMAQLGMQYGRDMVQSSIAKYMPGAAAMWTYLQVYFDVTNTYVKNKLIRVLFPFASREWERSPSSAADSDSGRAAAVSRFAPPSLDTNALDLYIPLMAFITFVLASGLLKGTHLKFTPEVLVNATSAGLVTSIIEVALLRLGLYLTSSEGCSILDLVSLTSYKYVGMVLCATIGLFFGSKGYYVALLYAGLSMAYFVVQFLSPLIRAGGSSSELAGAARALSPQSRTFVLVAGVLQMVFMWWIGLALEIV